MIGGQLVAGTRLPSSRLLAESLGVSRTTVALALDQLGAEGYVEGRERSGTFVARALPDDHLHVRRPAPPPRRARQAHAVPASPLSERGRLLETLTVSSVTRPAPAGMRAFRLGTPALDNFPFALWGRLLARRWRGVSAAQLGYGHAAGCAPLRAAIAAHVRQARAVDCEAEQVIVVSGAQQAFDLVARVLLDPGDVAAVEDPGYRGTRAALVAAGARLAHIPVDREGMQVAALHALPTPPAQAAGARLACVTPSHQFPLGVTMSAPRRLALLEWARATGGWIVEDDFDSEYRFRGHPLPSLHGLDTAARVLYVGTFSKTLFPALRLGYLVVPPALVHAFVSARAATDRHPSALEQAVVADFIAEGHFARHVRRMRALYAERQEQLLALLAAELGDVMEGERADAGMHLVAWLRAGWRDAALASRAHELGVTAVPLSDLAHRPLAREALLLGFAAFDAATMRDGVAALRRAAADR